MGDSGGEVPEWIAYYQEGDVLFGGVGEDGVGGGFDHFAVGEDYWAAIEEFLLRMISVWPLFRVLFGLYAL